MAIVLSTYRVPFSTHLPIRVIGGPMLGAGGRPLPYPVIVTCPVYPVNVLGGDVSRACPATKSLTSGRGSSGSYVGNSFVPDSGCQVAPVNG